MNKGYKLLQIQLLCTVLFAFMSMTISLQAFTGDGYSDTKATVAMLCDDVTNGGVISIGDNPGLNCGAYDPSTLMSMSPSEGGSGAIEYQWLSSTVGCPANIGQAIPGANSEYYDPGTITQTTYFVRCSRREGCGSWFNEGESNCIVLSIGDNHDPECAGNNGGGDDCSSIIITPGSGTLEIAGLDAAPISSLQVFTTSWAPVYSCFADCDATEMLNLPAGDYLVFVKYYEANYSLTCQIDGTFTVNACSDMTISADNGNIMVPGLDGAPISSVQVFTSTWSPVYSCFADCAALQWEIMVHQLIQLMM